MKRFLVFCCLVLLSAVFATDVFAAKVAKIMLTIWPNNPLKFSDFCVKMIAYLVKIKL